MSVVHRTTCLITGPAVVGGGIQEFYWDGFSSPTPASMIAAHAAFWDALKAIILVGHTFSVQSAVEDVEDSNGEITGLQSGTTTNVAATGSGSMLPPTVQGLVRWRTGTYRDGREVRGRTFIPGFITTVNSGGSVLAATVTTVEAAATALRTATPDLQVYSRERQARAQVGTPGEPGYKPALAYRAGDAFTVTASSMWTQFAVLRSRRD